ncbi:aminotransferase class III-fold pyridoxal phosphate-dependent enzyme [Pararoseomonas indoligenes]|uniref:Aminotransferase class III-fold pyridoxal phosphate-dependent enzyme n=1 Tax=Roseomonas indoligenes TaxID=2820811 RepID=A0A940MY28_9PROT|nr:aminotransferase class III-fold pyridoxal phosphate-dependent enzyme [Pararoseomonas indoligenes]MBP0494226.1 aminotransferase class III-fold pyridoxal phosphate-dependent enzyme [Pararoseomonas indoligenes]
MSRLLRTGLNAGTAAPSVVGGEGVHFLLSDGRRVLDGSNTGGPLGHGHPRMAEALRKAASLPMVSEGWAWAGRDRAAEELFGIGLAGEDWAGAVRFCLSGSEANDIALSLCQALSGRRAIATRERAYHGLVGLSRDVTVQPHWHGGLAAPGATRVPPAGAPVHVLPPPEGAAWRADGAVVPPIAQRLHGAPGMLADSAAVILDYSQGGFYHDAAYQDAVAGMAREAGCLWIADEVVTGLGRAGRPFAFQGGASRPDIVTLGKGLGGGMQAVAAVVLSEEVVARMRGSSWQNYGTLRGHPMAMAAVSAYLTILREEALLERVAALEGLFRRRLVEMAGRHPSAFRVAGQGLHWTIELHGPDWREWRADVAEAPVASQVAARALELGAVIGTSGEQTSLFLAPPLVIGEVEAERLLAILDESLLVADRAHNGAQA